MRYIILSIFICASCGSVCAQQTLTLQECRDMAVKSNTQSVIAQKQAEKADYTIRQMRANFLPNLSLKGCWTASNMKYNYKVDGGYLPTFTPDPATGKLNPNIATVGGQPVMDANNNYVFNQYAYFPGMDFNLKFNSLFNASAVIEQPIFMGGKIVAGYKMAKIGKELAELNRKYTSNDIILESDKAYWNCLRAKSMVQALEQYHQTISEFRRNVQDAVEVGLKTSNDLLKIQVQENEAELNLTKANNALSLAKMNLCHVVGLPLTSDIDISDENMILNNDSTAVFLASDRTEYNMLSKKIALKEQEVKVTQADYLPNIGAMAGYGYTNGWKLNGTKLFDNASFAGMVTVSIPIFHWGEGVNKVKAAKSELEILKMQQNDVAQKMQLEVQQAHNTLLEAQMEVKITQRSVDQAKENMRISQDQYNVGRETIANLLEAQTMWQKALTNQVEAKANLCISQTNYLRAIGKL